MFEQENELYKQNLQKWLTEGLAGQFVVIKGADIVGIFPNGSDAFQAGITAYGLDNFFMNQILPTDAVNIVLVGLKCA